MIHSVMCHFCFGLLLCIAHSALLHLSLQPPKSLHLLDRILHSVTPSSLPFPKGSHFKIASCSPSLLSFYLEPSLTACANFPILRGMMAIMHSR